MIERNLGEGGTWYVVAAHYPSALMAKRAWERLNAKLDMRAGDEGIGITRLAPNTGRETMPSGAPKGTHNVIGVTLDRRTARKAERLLRDGTHWRPEQAFADALILRRARIVTQQSKLGQGRLVIRRPESRGAYLYPTGDLEERDPGQG